MLCCKLQLLCVNTARQEGASPYLVRVAEFGERDIDDRFCHPSHIRVLVYIEANVRIDNVTHIYEVLSTNITTKTAVNR